MNDSRTKTEIIEQAAAEQGVIVRHIPLAVPCDHDWPEADGQTDIYGSCTKCSMSFQRYIHTECP